MKKILALTLALAMVFSLTACGQKAKEEAAPAADASKTEEAASTDETKEAEPAKEAEASKDAEATKDGEKTVLKMWCIATESDANRPAYEKAISEFETAHPDIKIEWEAFENESYKKKIQVAMNDPDTLPDIFFTWSGAFLGDFVEAGNVLCLDDAYKPFAEQLPEKMLSNSTYGGKHYAVPLTYNIVTLFANMDLLAKAGYDKVPESYDDLIACCDALVKQGIVPFGCAGKEGWCVTEYVEPMIEKTIGYEKLNKIFSGAESWNDPAIADAVNKFQDMIKKGYFDPNGSALGNDEVKANFIAGKTAFYQNGSWNCGEVNDANGNFKVALFPVLDSAKATYGQVIGGPSDSLAVSAKANPAAAAAAFELGRSICHYAYLAGSGLPAWTPDYDTKEVKPLVSDVTALVAAADGMVLFGDTAMNAERKGIYLDYIDQVYGCAITGDDFVAGLTKDIG